MFYIYLSWKGVNSFPTLMVCLINFFWLQFILERLRKQYSSVLQYTLEVQMAALKIFSISHILYPYHLQGEKSTLKVSRGSWKGKEVIEFKGIIF